MGGGYMHQRNRCDGTTIAWRGMSKRISGAKVTAQIQRFSRIREIVIAALVAAIHRSTSVNYLDGSSLTEPWITATSAVMTMVVAVVPN